MLTSAALTTKAQNGSTYQLDANQVVRATDSLIKHIVKQKGEQETNAPKKSLFADAESEDEGTADDDVPIWLILTTKKFVVDKKRLKPGKIPLPHSLTTSPSTKICLITADPQRTYKDIIASPSFPAHVRSRISRVISISKLRAKYKSFESRRQLYAEHDVFLADERIVVFLPSVLGKVFYKGGAKRPVPVRMTGSDKTKPEKDQLGQRKRRPEGLAPQGIAVGKPEEVGKDVERALGAALVHLSPTNTTAVKVGWANWEREKVIENIKAVVNGLTERFVPKGWQNVRALHIKGPSTAALPIWLANELWVDEEDVIADDVEDIKAGEEPKAIEGGETMKCKKRKGVDGEAYLGEEKPKKKTKKIGDNIQAPGEKPKTRNDGDDVLTREIALRKKKLRKQKAEARAQVDSLLAKKRSRAIPA